MILFLSCPVDVIKTLRGGVVRGLPKGADARARLMCDVTFLLCAHQLTLGVIKTLRGDGEQVTANGFGETKLNQGGGEGGDGKKKA